MLLNLFSHIKGKPHPAQHRTASLAPDRSCKATRTHSLSRLSAPSTAERHPRLLCNTTRQEEGDHRHGSTQRSPEEPAAAKQNTKEVCCLPTEIQAFWACHCRADPLSKVRWLQEASSPPTQQLQREWELASLPGGHVWRGGFLTALSREEFSTMSVTAFIHPAFQQAGLRLSFCSAL